jgi:hypothetical protein
MKTLWIVTADYNDDHQYGDYFVAAFIEKPTFQDLKKTLPDEDNFTINRIINGEGRLGFEPVWYNIIEVKPGKNYHDE